MEKERKITRLDLERLNIVYWQLDAHGGKKELAEAVSDVYFFCEAALDKEEALDPVEYKPRATFREKVHVQPGKPE